MKLAIFLSFVSLMTAASTTFAAEFITADYKVVHCVNKCPDILPDEDPQSQVCGIGLSHKVSIIADKNSIILAEDFQTAQKLTGDEKEISTFQLGSHKRPLKDTYTLTKNSLSQFDAYGKSTYKTVYSIQDDGSLVQFHSVDTKDEENPHLEVTCTYKRVK